MGYTTGEIAKRLGVHLWQVRRIYERKLLPEPRRAGHYRLIDGKDIPKIRAALRKAGFLREAA